MDPVLSLVVLEEGVDITARLLVLASLGQTWFRCTAKKNTLFRNSASVANVWMCALQHQRHAHGDYHSTLTTLDYTGDMECFPMIR